MPFLICRHRQRGIDKRDDRFEEDSARGDSGPIEHRGGRPGDPQF